MGSQKWMRRSNTRSNEAFSPAILLLPPEMVLLPEVPVISTLMAESSVHSRITSIFPAVDSHIPEGSRVEGGRNIELPVTGHFRILLDTSLPDVVVEAVEAERADGTHGTD